MASEAWRRLMRLYGELEAEIVTRLDMDLIVDYCLVLEQTAEIDRMRKATYQIWLELGEAHDKTKRKALQADEEAAQAERAAQDAISQEAANEARELAVSKAAAAERLEEKAIRLASQCVDAFEAVIKLDGRVDRKRALLYQMRQGMYLTPRARAGTAPAKKEAEPEKDPLEQLLDNVTDFVNGDGK